ncbi:hypothetical protein GCM10023189_55480 [Nibrella saemangeumensis]|uniref:Lipoprotein n=1 Tax=Nibrella saemangeumensis TaxID=1084526 RepID=A0ABP8NL35_9BACT
MKQISVTILLLAILSCNREEVIPNTCGVKRPLRDLSWLRTWIEASKNVSADVTIYSARYKGQTAFLLDYFYGPDYGEATLHRCDGSLICTVKMTIGGPVGDCYTIRDQISEQKKIFERKR